jgi:hypothetical protein
MKKKTKKSEEKLEKNEEILERRIFFFEVEWKKDFLKKKSKDKQTEKDKQIKFKRIISLFFFLDSIFELKR